jgi:hypothetical protein
LGFLTDFLGNLSLVQALLYALFFALIFWAVLWSYEAHYFKKKSNELDVLHGFCCESLEELDIPFGYFSEKGHPYVNDLFLSTLGIQPGEDIRDGVVKKLKTVIAVDTWRDLSHYLEFQSQAFMYVFE